MRIGRKGAALLLALAVTLCACGPAAAVRKYDRDYHIDKQNNFRCWISCDRRTSPLPKGTTSGSTTWWSRSPK